MIEVQNVTKELKGSRILSNINLTLEGGKTYLVTGQNGCGKTMLLRAICGLITPTQGEVITSRPLRYGVIIETPAVKIGG